jgi:hypothetical protein
MELEWADLARLASRRVGAEEGGGGGGPGEAELSGPQYRRGDARSIREREISKWMYVRMT